MPVRDHRIGADEHHEVGAVVVRTTGEADESTDQIGDQRFRRAVDGQRAEPRGCPECCVQCFGLPGSGRVHPDSRAEENADGFGSVAVDDPAQARGEVVEALVPRDVPQDTVDAQLRSFDAGRMMMHLRQGSPLRTGVAAREGMLPVAAHTRDDVAVHVDEDSAQRGADATEAAYGSPRADRHHVLSPEPGGDPAHTKVVSDNNDVNDNIPGIVRPCARGPTTTAT